MLNFNEKITLLDGAAGTQFQAMGMPSGVCPELWILEHPDALERVLRAYYNSGSQALLSPTFGANPIKLKEYGLSKRCEELNRELARRSKDAVPDAFVGGDIGPTGKLLHPLGDLSFDEAVNAYTLQANALKEGGVDYLAIETMMDLQEARAAIIGCKTTGLPVIVTMTFENGRTLTGVDPATAVTSLQDLGADAVGCNCGAGPDEMLPVIEEMSRFANVPIVAKPNAGLPVYVNGLTTYPLDAHAFAKSARKLIAAGASLIGGCCGTTPEHIAALRDALEE